MDYAARYKPPVSLYRKTATLLQQRSMTRTLIYLVSFAPYGTRTRLSCKRWV
jgi:hypothetical protein